MKTMAPLAALLLLPVGQVSAAEEAGDPSTEALTKAAQNPVADLISIPFQNNTNFGYGPANDKTQNVLNIQPVVPIHVVKDWNLITRTIFPLVWQPGFTDGGTTFGLGNVSFTAFLSPSTPGALIWGVGPVATFPASSASVGSSDTWGLGPSAVLLTMPGPWVIGVLANNVWSVDGTKRNDLLIQYFVNYNFGNTGWYLTSAPIITADWEASPAQRWIVPIGGGAGKLVRLGKLPVNANVSAFYNAVQPDIGPQWSLRVQLAILLPASMP